MWVMIKKGMEGYIMYIQFWTFTGSCENKMQDVSQQIAILGIGTAIPAYRLDQVDAAQRLAEALAGNPDSARWAKRIFRQCGVETRYTCEASLLASGSDIRYLPGESNELAPSTAERMRTYKRESVPLALKAAKRALSDGKTDAGEITHLITVSCTGQFLPGIDAVLIQELGLSTTVMRIPLNFLGCAAGLKAICFARQIIAAHPSAKILTVCVELCSLHIQPSGRREDLFAASFFGDGASACVVGSAEAKHEDIFELGKDHSVLLPDSADKMVWEVGNFGFNLFLSPEIPKLIGQFIPAEVERLLDGEKTALDLWAIHPGGRGIIDNLQQMFGLTDKQTRPSLSVLRNYGNISSATILFVLSEMKRELKDHGSGPVQGIAMAFGPGLTAEMLRICYQPAAIKLNQFTGVGAYV
jgi:predicted naringenin-chalcone synthase